MADCKTVIAIATSEVGYLEKASNNNLDSKTANAGNANYTKYGRDRGCNGQAWCGAFVDWCFINAYGYDIAKSMVGGFSNYTPTMADNFKKMGSFFATPQVGDVIFFKNSQRICHTGIVYNVSATKVYTIEGNTNGGNTLVANGGSVACKSYSLTYNRIAGYGRPLYTEEIIQYKVGFTYTTLVDLNIRQEPKGEKQKFECITQDAKNHSHFDDYGNAILNKGTRVDCLSVKKLTASTWLLIPSGWICAISDEGKTYVQ